MAASCTSTRFPAKSSQLRFPLPDGGPLVVTTAGVSWVRDQPSASPVELPAGCGVRFVMMSQTDRRRVEILVQTYQRGCQPLLGEEQPASRSVRVPMIAPCRLTGEFGYADGRTCDLSIFGIYAAVDPIPEAGIEVRVELWLAGKPEPFARRGTVTWRNLGEPTWEHPLPPGCGVRFEGLSLKDVRYLSRLVEEGLAQMPSTSD